MESESTSTRGSGIDRVRRRTSPRNQVEGSGLSHRRSEHGRRLGNAETGTLADDLPAWADALAHVTGSVVIRGRGCVVFVMMLVLRLVVILLLRSMVGRWSSLGPSMVMAARTEADSAAQGVAGYRKE